MEHIPVWLHEFSKEKGVVRHRRDMDGVRCRVPGVEVIRCSYHSSLFPTAWIGNSHKFIYRFIYQEYMFITKNMHACPTCISRPCCGTCTRCSHCLGNSEQWKLQGPGGSCGWGRHGLHGQHQGFQWYFGHRPSLHQHHRRPDRHEVHCRNWRPSWGSQGPAHGRQGCPWQCQAGCPSLQGIGLGTPAHCHSVPYQQQLVSHHPSIQLEHAIHRQTCFRVHTVNVRARLKEQLDYNVSMWIYKQLERDLKQKEWARDCSLDVVMLLGVVYNYLQPGNLIISSILLKLGILLYPCKPAGKPATKIIKYNIRSVDQLQTVNLKWYLSRFSTTTATIIWAQLLISLLSYFGDLTYLNFL